LAADRNQLAEESLIRAISLSVTGMKEDRYRAPEKREMPFLV
jgi:hypothetical protein